MSLPYADFPSAFKGQLVTTESANYAEVRHIYNMRTAADRPSLIARCTDADDVALAMQFAYRKELPVALRSGGHGVDGTAMPDGALVLDLTPMKKTFVDPQSRIARVESGVLLGEMDVATQQHGLVIPAGTVSNTGVAGLTLGGGIGHNMRRFGATVDSLLSCEMVTVDGRKIRAGKTENPELFWALKGAGANFGVVTSFEFQAHPLGPEVISGMILFPDEQIEEVMAKLSDHMDHAPRELGLLGGLTQCPPLPPIDPSAYGTTVLVLIVVYTGPVADAGKVIDSLTSLGRPLANLTAPARWVETNSMLDAIAPFGRRAFALGGYLPGLGDEAIRIAVKHARNCPAPESPGPSSVQNFWCMGGAISEDFSEDSAAFSREGAKWIWESVVQWDTAGKDAAFEGWLTALNEELRPHLLKNGYINLTCDQGPEWLSGLYGSPEKFARIRKVKTDWDPGNLLRFNKNIPPLG